MEHWRRPPALPGNKKRRAGLRSSWQRTRQWKTLQEREGPGLLVFAQPVPGGYIVGKFPPVIVPTEADFRATLRCQPGASGCFVRFRVTYRVDGGDEELLGEWNEGSEGGVTNAIKDLDMVGGRSTAFTFYLYCGRFAGTKQRGVVQP